MSLDITELRTQLRGHLFGFDNKDDVDEMSNSEADGFLNRAFWEVSDKFPFRETQASLTLSTVDGTAAYDLSTEIPNLHAIRKVRLYDSNTERWYKLDRATLDWYNNQESYYINGLFPSRYVRDGDRLLLFNTPSAAWDVEVSYLKDLTSLSDENPDVDLPRSWHEIILYGALWRAYMQQKNWEAMNAARAVAFGLINSSVPVEAKEETDSNRAGVVAVRNSWRRGR